MRVAFAMINCNRSGGSARAVNEVAERLADRHEVCVFARKVKDLDLRTVKWNRVPGPGWPEVADFTSYHLLTAALIRPEHFDIVHSVGCNARSANVITIQNIQPAKQKILRNLQDRKQVSIARRWTRWLYLEVTSFAERQMYSWSRGRIPPLFLPVSRGVEEELRRFYNIGGAPVRIIPNAADTERFRPLGDEARNAWRERHGFEDKDIVLTFSGGEWSRKGLDLAIAAVAKINDPKVKLLVVGDDPDRAEFYRMARSLGIAERVFFSGFRIDVEVALASADLFLFPSRYEAFSLATIEAAACGLPVIAARISGTEEFIQPGATGDFVPHDAEGIAQTLRPWIVDRERRKQAGESARRLVEANYTWDRVANMTEQAYVEYLSEFRTRRPYKLRLE